MVMLPKGQEKRELCSLIDKVNFVVARMLVDNQTDPILPKQQKVQPNVHLIAPQTTVKANNLNQRKGWTELLKQGAVEASPDDGK